MTERVAAFVGLAAVLTAVPGPAIILIMKSSLARGRRSAGLTALGVFGGDLVWVATSLLGLTTLLIAYRPAFEVLRLLGAAYLIYLGLRLVLHRAHGRAVIDPGDTTAEATERSRSARRAVTEGALCELSNPKTLVVFTSVIPPFLPTDGGLPALVTFGLLFAVTGLVVCLIYAAVLGTTGRALRPGRSPRLVRGLLRGSGGALTAFGVGLVVEGLREA